MDKKLLTINGARSFVLKKVRFAFAHIDVGTKTSQRPPFAVRSAALFVKAHPICAIGLLLLISQAVSSAQTVRSRPRMTEPLEKYNMAPAYIYRLEAGPRMISRFGPFTSFQVNVDASGNNILGDAANETSITVDPTNHDRMAIGWRQFNSVQSDFRQGGYGYTTDAGTTWTFPGVLEPGVFRSDPVLKSDEVGNFFYLSLLQSFCVNMYSSLDFGQTWTRLQPDGEAGGADKEWFTIDKTDGPG